VREFPVHVLNGGEVHRSILPNCRVRTAACFHAHDSLCRQGFGACKNELVFLRIDVVGNHVDVVVVPEPLAKRFHEGSFA
jgi:hypothetical protein